jgi:hypothetical protein
MSRPRGLPHSIRHTGIECTFLPEVYMYTTLARTQTHGHETASLRSVMSGAAVTRTTENKSAMAFEHSGMPSFAPGDSVLESQGADGLRTAKLSQNSDIGSGTPTKCRAQVLPAELSDSNMLSSVPGDSALESQGAGGLRTAKLSQFFWAATPVQWQSDQHWYRVAEPASRIASSRQPLQLEVEMSSDGKLEYTHFETMCSLRWLCTSG